MSELTIAQVRDAKDGLELQIATLLEEFETKTGAKVEDIDSERLYTLAGDIIHYNVTVEVVI